MEELMIMRSDGTGAHAVPNGHLHGKTLANPSFSPSSRSITFAATELNRYGGTYGATVFVIGRDGSAPTRVQRGVTQSYGNNPVWVP